ncbi:MAG TPA: cysteine desulfurase family protein [Candidatus Nanoarchaeia archaeon]|nr:cysteine desulfurase family protein [Candidatus Nanoarchaeia archaeon]
MSKAKIYLDYAAATPMDPSVKKSMEPYLSDHFYNPSSLYAAARFSKAELEATRGRLSQILGSKPSEVVFTAGGTESVNLAILGVARKFAGSRVIASAIEHEAVLESLKLLQNEGHATQLVPVKRNGIIDTQTMASAIDDQTVLVSVMYANNEIGTIQPISKIADLVEAIKKDRLKRGIELPLYLHTDAAQAAGYLDLHVSRLRVDLLSLNGSKIYGPKQTGLLYVRTGVQLQAQVVGGGQERGRRSGTENLAGAVGLATALELVQSKRQSESKRLVGLRQELIKAAKKLGGVLNGDATKRLAGNVNLTFDGIDGEQAVFYFDEAGFEISTGSACAAASEEPSHVLLAIGLSAQQASSSLRFTMGSGTSPQDIELLTKALPGLVKRLRQLAKTSQGH